MKIDNTFFIGFYILMLCCLLKVVSFELAEIAFPLVRFFQNLGLISGALDLNNTKVANMVVDTLDKVFLDLEIIGIVVVLILIYKKRH